MLKAFKNNKILLAYYVGSKAYKTDDVASDTDIVVVIEELNGVQHVVSDEKKIEYYVFGKDYFTRKMEFDEEITPYLKIFNDDILSNLEPILIDESFKDVYLKYKNRDVSEYLVKYLQSVIEYYQIFLESDALKKNMYHLYRIDEQIKRYLETGEFKLEISQSVLEKIQVFKENYQTNHMELTNELKGILSYLKGVLEDVRN